MFSFTRKRILLPEFWEAGTGTAAAVFDYTQVQEGAAS